MKHALTSAMIWFAMAISATAESVDDRIKEAYNRGYSAGYEAGKADSSGGQGFGLAGLNPDGPTIITPRGGGEAGMVIRDPYILKMLNNDSAKAADVFYYDGKNVYKDRYIADILKFGTDEATFDYDKIKTLETIDLPDGSPVLERIKIMQELGAKSGMVFDGALPMQ